MRAELTPLRAVLINAGAWLAIHLGASYLASRLPLAWFRSEGWLYRTRRWERGGRFYERAFGIRAWKHALPDGAALSRRGFRKRRMANRSPEYCRTFVLETCRAELTHWLVLALVPLFLLWNPWYVALLMVPYAVAANVPCIAAQRYNRPRLAGLAALGDARQGRGRPAPATPIAPRGRPARNAGSNRA